VPILKVGGVGTKRYNRLEIWVDRVSKDVKNSSSQLARSLNERKKGDEEGKAKRKSKTLKFVSDPRKN
jgi:hypothetical protein